MGLAYGEEDKSRIPIALSAFGDIFYYRKLSEEGDEDIAFIDPHTSQTAVLTWSLEDFFNDWCCDPETITDVLQNPLMEKAHKKCGALGNEEIYYFVPALRLGGNRSIENVKKGNAQAHLSILLQLTQ